MFIVIPDDTSFFQYTTFQTFAFGTESSQFETHVICPIILMTVVDDHFLYRTLLYWIVISGR